MTWFKVDDGLHSHRKAVRAGVPAMGLWVLAGSWASDQLTDGWVPDYIAARLDPGQFEKHASALVKAGLWFPDEHDGERGWWFHQWQDHQPSAKSVHEKRDAAKERMRRVRDERRGQRRSEAESFAECSREQVENASRTSREVRLTPTRPDPTRPVVPTELQEDMSLTGHVSLSLVPDPDRESSDSAKTKTARKRPAHSYDGDPQFVRWWNVYPRKTGKPSAWSAWKAAIKRGADPEQLIAAAEAYRDEPGRTVKFTKHPGPWLNDERYNDQPQRDTLPAASGGWWNN